MNDIVIIDSNLLLLLVVGSASISYIGKHDRLRGYSQTEFETLGKLVSEFSEIVSIPHVWAEVSNLARQIKGPAQRSILEKLSTFISTTKELNLPSRNGVLRDEFYRLGLTDSVLLHLCALRLNGLVPTLVTVDAALANAANSLGYSVIDFKQDFQSQGPAAG